MTFRNDDDFTRNLNDRIKELEDMSNEINDQTTELEDRATQAEDETTLLDDAATQADDEATQAEEAATNQAETARQEGDTIFFTAKLDATKPLKLNITNNTGDISVSSTDGDSVEIEATRNSGEDVDHAHWFFQQLNNEVTLRPNWQVGSHVGELASKLKTQLKEGFRTSDWSSKDFKFGLDVNYDLVVRLPKNLAEGSRVTIKNANGDGQLHDVTAEVDFKTANGDLQVNDVVGSLTINSANGDLKATDIAGNVQASTANGDIHLGDIAGAIESNTANGDVQISNSTGAVSVRTANGDIHLEHATWSGGRLVTIAGEIKVDAALTSNAAYHFDSVSGGIHVIARVPEAGATFTAKTVNGQIEADGEFEKRGRRDWVVGAAGGPRLNAKSVSADIHVTATTDHGITLEERVPGEEAAAESGSSPAKKGGEVNVNIDLELERAKGWIKDISGKLGAMLGETDSKRADFTPEVPEPPMPPQAPEMPAEVKAATADRRTKLLEAVKNGEMTVDEALAELERNA